MKYLSIFLVMMAFVFCIQSVSATMLLTNASFINNGTMSNSVEGVKFRAQASNTLSVAVRMNGNNVTRCVVIEDETNLTLAIASFSGNNCTLSFNIQAGKTYRIGANGTGTDTYGSGSFPVVYPGFGNFTTGCFGTYCEELSSNVYNIYGIDIVTSASKLIIPVLNAPVSGSTYSNGNITFNSSGTPFNLNLTNATLYIWNTNGTLVNRTTNTVLGNNTNTTTWLAGGFTIGNYEWNAYWCGSNSTFHNCSFAESNFTFQWRPFSLINSSYIFGVYETSRETFSIDITTLPNILSVSGALIYDGVTYTATSNCSSPNCTLSRSIDIPTINLTTSANQENKSFNWVINVFDGSTTVSFNNSFRNQSVNRIYLQECTPAISSLNLTLNFTAYDEQNKSRISPFKFAATFNYWLGGGTTYKNLSLNNLTLVERPICIFPNNITFKTTAQIDYSGTNATNSTYNQRNYFFQNASLTNVTQHIKLFLLNAESSTSFIQKVITTSQIPVEEALIFTQRYYPSDNTFETVSVSKTNGDGESVGFYEVEIPDYRHLITKNGELLKLTEQGKVFPESSPYTLLFTIGDDFDNPWESFGNITSLFSTLDFNKTTNIVTYTWIDATGGLSVANLTVFKLRGNQTDDLVCMQSSILQAGTLSCNLTGYDGTLVARGYIGRSPSRLDKLITIVMNEIRDALARPFLFLWIMLLLVAMSIGVYYPPAGIPILGIVIGMGVILGITAVGWIFVWAIVGVGIWILIESSR